MIELFLFVLLLVMFRACKIKDLSCLKQCGVNCDDLRVLRNNFPLTADLRRNEIQSEKSCFRRFMWKFAAVANIFNLSILLNGFSWRNAARPLPWKSMSQIFFLKTASRFSIVKHFLHFTIR